jgi:hypothetical protein
MRDWTTWVATPEAHARASGRRRYNKQRQQAAQARRVQVEGLLQRWGPSTAAKVKMARLLRVSVRTIDRDLHALQDRPPVPVICPTCGLPSRLDLDPSTLTDDPEALARLVRSGEDREACARQADGLPSPRPERLQRNDRPPPKGRTLGTPASAVWD